MKFDREHLKDELMSHYAEEELDIHGKLDNHSRSRLKPILFAMVLVVAALTAYLWYRGIFSLSSTSSTVTVVHSDNAPVRFKPKDPGGMVIGGGDKMIYDHISGSKNASAEEVMRVLPQAEEPISRDGLNAEPDGTASASKLSADPQGSAKKLDIGELPKDVEPIRNQDTPEQSTSSAAALHPVDAGRATIPSEPSSVSGKVELETTGAASSDLTLQKHVVKPAESLPVRTQLTATDLKKSPLPIRKGELLTLPDPAKKRGYFIQLGSFREEKDVHQSWQILQKHYATLLRKLSYLSEKADLGEQGIFYRLQVGPFKSEHEARTLCQDLIERKQRCFFVK